MSEVSPVTRIHDSAAAAFRVLGRAAAAASVGISRDMKAITKTFAPRASKTYATSWATATVATGPRGGHLLLECPARHMTIQSTVRLSSAVCWCGRSMVERR